jgi:hypothetical protein
VEWLLSWLARIPAGPVVTIVVVAGICLMSGPPSASQPVPELEGLKVNRAIARAAKGGGSSPEIVFRKLAWSRGR